MLILSLIDSFLIKVAMTQVKRFLWTGRPPIGLSKTNMQSKIQIGYRSNGHFKIGKSLSRYTIDQIQHVINNGRMGALLERFGYQVLYKQRLWPIKIYF